MSLDKHVEATPARILVVDDQPANLLALEVVLEPLRQPIVCVDSGTAALRAALETDFAVILMDVRMPGLDGMETASLIRERQRSRHIPIIFVTAEPSELEEIRHAYALGGVDYVVKPFDPLIMRSKVAAFVQLHEQAECLRRTAGQLASESGGRMLAEHAVQAKDITISILGHDLRTPLAVLQTGVEALQATPQSDQNFLILERMQRSVRRMDRMVGNVLDFARASLGGGMQVAREPGDLAESVSEVVEELRLSHPNREILLETRGSPECTFDAERMGQVVSNLVGNALQHSRLNPVSVLIDGTDGERVRLAVCNCGTIPDQTMPRLFEPFRRADDSSNGLGLGLYIVREIARAHGGKVDVEVDRENEITSFVFELPRIVDATK